MISDCIKCGKSFPDSDLIRTTEGITCTCCGYSIFLEEKIIGVVE